MAMTPGGRPAWTRWGLAGLAWALWILTVLGVAATAWFDHLLGQAGRPELVQLSAGGGSAGPLGGERGHGRGGPGQPSASSSGGLAPGGLRAGSPGAVQRCRRLRPLRAPGPTRNGARHHPRGRARLDHLRPQPGLDRVYPAAHPHRGAAVSPLALLGLDRGGPAGGVRAVVAVWDTTARPRFAVAGGRHPVRHR